MVVAGLILHKKHVRVVGYNFDLNGSVQDLEQRMAKLVADLKTFVQSNNRAVLAKDLYFRWSELK